MGVMITRKMKIRRSLRSARASALTSEERQMELREAERSYTQHDDRRAAVADVDVKPSPEAEADAP